MISNITSTHVGGDCPRDNEQVLKARHFLKTVNGEQRLTNAAVLLFAKDIQALYPNCRVRFIRYDGTTAGVGTSINITKDVSIEYSLLRLIDKAREFKIAPR